MAHLYEGDIVLNPQQAELLENGTEDRNAITLLSMKWPKANGVVKIPYYLRTNYNTKQRAVISRAITEIESKTCIRCV